MKKILTLFAVGVIFLNGLGAVAVTNSITINNINKNETVKKSEIITIEFSPFVIEEYDNEYIEIKDLVN